MYFQIGIIFVIMVIAYALAKWKKLSMEKDNSDHLFYRKEDFFSVTYHDGLFD